MPSLISRMFPAALAGAIGLGTAVPVVAEPINILGGTIVYSRSNQATIDLALSQGRIVGMFGDSGSESWTPAHACFGCTPASTLNPSISESFRHRDPPGDVSVGGLFMFNGQNYRLTDLIFSIVADSVRLPAVFRDDDAGGAESTIAQFTLRGLAMGRSPDNLSGTGLALLGHGKVGVLFENANWFQTTFTFDDPATVPEPASLLLFGTGALGLAARRRIRR